MPHESPPPPYGTTTASTPGRPRSTSVCHHASKGTLIVRAPSRSTAACLVCGAWSGITTVQGTPCCRAHQATPWAMFPALAVHTPRASAAGPAAAIALPAPRSLKEPMGCRFSSLRWISAGASSTFSRTSGVRVAMPTSRSRAARISGSDGASSSDIPRPSQLHAGARPGGESVVVDEPGRGHVLDREPEGLENGDVGLGLAPPAAPEEQLAQLAADVV